MQKKYERVIKHIEKLIESNRLKQGERLPSIRLMADKLKCNKATVIRAYDELVMNHRLYTIPKSGYYLIETNKSDKEESKLIDFSEAIPDPRLLPYKEFNHCINKAVEIYRDSLFLCTETQGMQSLRKVLKDHFSEYQVFTAEEKIFITSGSQQALSILSNMPFPNGKQNILVEQPTYRLMQDMAILNGNKLIGIKRNFDGIDLKELEKIFKQESIKFFYTIPRFHNPLGTSYSEKEKLKIVELAQKYDVYIVEDDYFIDIETNRKALPLYYYDTSKKVIYIKSFSKTFMPGIRIGAVVLQDHLKDEFFKHKRCHDQSTSVLAQGALEIFINSGMYKNHVRKIQREYGKKMTCLREFLRIQSIDGFEYFVPPTGFFIWIKLPSELNVNTLAGRLKDKNVLISTAKEFLTVSQPDENSFRIAISHLPVDQIRCGLRTVFEEIKAYVSQ